MGVSPGLSRTRLLSENRQQQRPIQIIEEAMANPFSLESYYLRLRTKKLGRPCLYLDRVESTIEVAEKQKYNTLVLAKEQTNGRGQRGNKWISPVGCAMASLRIECPKISPLAKRLCFLQHIMAMSAAWALEKIDPVRLGREYIALKWPNDIVYKRGLLKLGGILVKTLDRPDHHDVTLSFGLNVHNREPTTCIEEILSSGTSNDNIDLSIDSVIADIMNNLEYYTYELDDNKFKRIKEEYESRCLQMNKVVLDAEHGTILVKGVSDEGYLIGEDSLSGRSRTITRII